MVRSSPKTLPLAQSPVAPQEPPKLPSQILDAAADLIEPEGCWTADNFARDVTGRCVVETSERAVCWCAAGAINRAADDLSAWCLGAGNYLRRTLPEAHIPDWNDAPNRTQAEVVSALRKAADLARSEGQ